MPLETERRNIPGSQRTLKLLLKFQFLLLFCLKIKHIPSISWTAISSFLYCADDRAPFKGRSRARRRGKGSPERCWLAIYLPCRRLIPSLFCPIPLVTESLGLIHVWEILYKNDSLQCQTISISLIINNL